MPERPSASPILMLVSLRPSVCDQPDGHFDRSTENPSGPVSEAPSADTPHLLSLIRCTTAARSLAHSASQSSPPHAAAAPKVTPTVSTATHRIPLLAILLPLFVLPLGTLPARSLPCLGR